MASPTIELRALARTGAEALGRGDARTACDCFEAIASAGAADAGVLIALAHAHRLLGNTTGALAAIDRALGLEPRNLRALVFKGDHLEAAGDARAASAFYLAAVRSTSSPEQLESELRPDLARAQAMCRRYAADFEAFLRERLAHAGLEEGSAERFATSLDILTGRKRIYLQEPRYYYFPGLAAIPFHERGDFSFLDAVEAATGDIRAELEEVLKEDAAFKPYIQSSPERPRKEQDGMLDNPAWSAFYLWKDGEIVAENAARCPRTLQALAGVPLTRVGNRSPSVLFSLLRPGAHIPPHSGMVNTRLICHLPLIVPGQCSFRVGNEVREWVEGKAWVFDDTIEHEAWNRSDRTRVILLFEIWRPELSDRERSLVEAMFAAIDAHSGQKPAWEI